jgi:hypothetical protein
MSTEVFHPLVDRRIGLTQKGNLAGNGIQITRPCVDASITVGAESTNVRAITIQLKDANGDDINYAETVEVIVFGAADMLSFASTGGSTGIAIGTDGALLDVVAKKYFLATSEVDGDIDLTWTDTGTESVALGVRLPNGRVVVTAAFANA